MIVKTIRVVTFNASETAAVKALFDDLRGHGSTWSEEDGDDGARRIFRADGTDRWEVEHLALRAQGNVSAAAALAEFQSQTTSRPFAVLVFYGCAGVPTKAEVGSFYLVRSTTYVSLGKVWNATKGEVGKTAPASRWKERGEVASKWLVKSPNEDDPLPTLQADEDIGPGAVHLARLVPCTLAHVAATDKVIEVDLGIDRAPSGALPKNTRWTYADALAHVAGRIKAFEDPAMLIDMESYGILRMAKALGVSERVAIARVSTDALTDKADPEGLSPEALLTEANPLLGAVLFSILTGRTLL